MKCLEFKMLYSSYNTVNIRPKPQQQQPKKKKKMGGGGGREGIAHTCPAVSIISVAKSCPLCLMMRLKVFSIVG